MSFITVLIPTLIFMFGVSFLVHHFIDGMDTSSSGAPEIQPVEVVNIGDFGRK